MRYFIACLGLCSLLASPISGPMAVAQVVQVEGARVKAVQIENGSAPRARHVSVVRPTPLYNRDKMRLMAQRQERQRLHKQALAQTRLAQKEYKRSVKAIETRLEAIEETQSELLRLPNHRHRPRIDAYRSHRGGFLDNRVLVKSGQGYTLRKSPITALTFTPARRLTRTYH